MSGNRAWRVIATLAVLNLWAFVPTNAQRYPTDDPVIKRIWDEGMTDRSQAGTLAQLLMDSIGPRLTASRGHEAAVDWLLSLYQRWGVSARKEKYGTWLGWRREYTHVDLISPRERTLEATMLAWSPGTSGPVEGDVVLAPDVADSASFQAWLGSAKGRFVLMSFAEPTCRPDENWDRLARPESITRMRAARDSARRGWNARVERLGRGATWIGPAWRASSRRYGRPAGVSTRSSPPTPRKHQCSM
jgi:carboxypeptidase Q